MRSERTQVLIIGGGPVGLSTALHLDRQGIDCIVVEKHPGTATHPKASYFNVRTMEILARLGVANDVYASALLPTGVAFYTKLTGYKLGVLDAVDYPDHVERVMTSSATPGCVSSQVVLEAILAEHIARAPHVRLRFGHEKIDLKQDATRVRVTIHDRAADSDYAIDADYVIACEGVRSSTREACGRKLVGPPPFGHVINIYLEADLESLIEERNQALLWTSTPRATGAFIALGGNRRRYCFNTPYFPERGEDPADFTQERCLDLVYEAIGTRDLPVQILAVGPWLLCGQVIDEYRHGRVFFGGDTAHLNIPTGGFGFNTGMQETHNLAWKLGAVLNGIAPDRLLDTYHQERRPIAEFNVEKSRENAINIRRTGATFGGEVPENDEIDLDTPRGRAQRADRAAAIREQKTHFLFLGQEIGFGYWDSPIVVPDGTPHYAELFDIDDPVYVYMANARPGARAPHVWVEDRHDPGNRHSLLDRLDGGFVLLTHGRNGAAWVRELDAAPLPVRHFHIGAPAESCDLVDVDAAWSAAYGIVADGAVLVRPDGHVAWRATAAPDEHVGIGLRQALDISLARAVAEHT